MKSEENILEHAFAQLELNTGIRANWNYHPDVIDGEADIFIDGRSFHTYVEVKREVRQYQLEWILEQASNYRPLMIVSENIFPKIKERLREERIAYLDTAGNIFINEGGHYIWIDGHKQPSKTKAIINRAFTKTGLKVVFFLLSNPDAINMPYRELATFTEVALGNIANVMDGLRDAGYIFQIDKQRRLLHKKKALLNRFIDGYRETLKPSLHIGNFRFWDKDAIHNWNMLQFPEEITALWSGEPAAALLTNYLQPQHLTLYTRNKSDILPKWKLIPDQEGALHLYEPFWTEHDKQPGDLVPILLVYIDLMLTDDPRCLEMAEIIYDKYLRDELESN